MPYIGRPVFGYTHFGDPFFGVLNACADGHIHLMPLQCDKAITNAKIKKLKHRAKIKSAKLKAHANSKAKISVYDGGPFIPGFGFGLGAGIGFALPLFLIGALFLL